MVTEALMSIVAGVATFFAGLMPSFAPPDWMTTLPDKVGAVGSYINSVDVWLPFSHAAIVLGFIALAVLVGVIVRGVRIAASFATLGGGAAG
jgi:hypothetical protein